MSHEQSAYCAIGDLKDYAADIACGRVEAIERFMRAVPERYADFNRSLADIECEKGALIQKLDDDALALEPLLLAYMAYHSELVFEVYKQAMIDGGRVYHAFVTQELPMKEEAP